jgi:chaperonin GroEL
MSACAAHDDPAVLALMEPVLDRLAAGAAAAVEESAQMESSASVVPGLRIPHGHLTRHVVNRPKTGEVMLEDARVLVFQSRVEDAAATARFLERAAAVGRPVLLFVSEMDADPLATVVLNHVRGTVHACPVRVSGEEIFEDLAAFSGATRIGPESGIRLDGVGTDQLGSVRRAVIDEDSTTLTEGRGNVRPRVDALRKRLQDPELSILDRESLQERAARLSGGLIQIFAGGPSGHEMRRRYSLIRAAIHAVRGGIQGGAVAGGGAALWSSGRGDPFPAFPEALSAPLSWIATNSGETPSSVLARLRGPRDGWDAVRGRVDDLAKAGILDPWFVVRDSLRTAWSLARTFLECDAIVAQKDPAPEPVLPDTLEEAERARRVLKNR